MTCPGFWPDLGTPCLRQFNRHGKCPKLHDPAHILTHAGTWPAHSVVEVTSVVTGELIARWCEDCEETIWTWDVEYAET